ncbi:DUF1700 domain-containing protein [Paenibacillus sp. Marseille-Q4541]|uniref:DUF1700 domain-containing protein n=1 Tax=Paenibacillus sp. Marseille-Q4541 TaxID=2831522 RepID=UPI001BAC2AF4|nr:DUF1700 domain-containing protein [Paenibacillus sp. Marseille-Q4541]
MNRLQFMTIMQRGLYPLEAQERAELLSDYEQHFEMGLSEGKSEEEIASELGNPEDLIKEALGDRYTPPAPGFRSQNGVHDEELGSYNKMPYGSSALSHKSSGGSFTRRLFTWIGLVFLNLILALPIFATIWAIWVSLAAISVSGILAPLLAFLDFIFIEKQVILPELFVSLVFLGIGILVGILALGLMKKLARWTAGYFNWNQTVLKRKEN